MAGRLRIAAQALALAAVAGLLGLLIWKVTHQAGAGVGRDVDRGKRPMAPNFDLPRLDGRGNLRLASLKGNVVVLNFWATWCDPCVREAPVLASAHRAWRGRGVKFVGVDVKDGKSDARRFVRAKGLTYPHVRDPVAKTALAFDAYLYPETFFIARSGRVVKRIKGELTRSQLDANIRRALGA